VSEHEKITELCVKLGAARAPAATMARQLVKRAEQIARQRGIPRADALAQLLQILVQGRHGNVPAEFKPHGGLSRQDGWS
jgi:hypothetical protein